MLVTKLQQLEAGGLKEQPVSYGNVNELGRNSCRNLKSVIAK